MCLTSNEIQVYCKKCSGKILLIGISMEYPGKFWEKETSDPENLIRP